jgi:3-carboxy-cis,cis-muconate cycloisomerase
VAEQGGTLAQALKQVPEVTAHLDSADLDRLTDPANYLGMAPRMVDRAIERSGMPSDPAER